MPESRLTDRSIIPIFHLPTRDNEMFDSSDFKRKKNLVLFFLTGLEPGFLLRAEDAYSGIRKGNAELVVIAPVKQEEVEAFYKKNRLTFFILADENREIFSKFISFEKDEPFSALFITDKYGEVFFHYIEKDVKELPPFEDIFKSLDFVESQCPECSGGI